jgi:hypothetical protein
MLFQNKIKDILDTPQTRFKSLFPNFRKLLKMSAQFSNISLYIPHVFPNYTKEDVQQVFENQKIGKVSRVDFVSKMGKDGKPYNAAYIHFEFWCDTIANRNLQARICDPTKEARIVYDEPWHWIVLENTAKKHISGQPKPRINLDTPVINRLSTVPPAPQKSATELAIIAAARSTGWHWPVAMPQPALAEDDADFLALVGDMASDPDDAEFKQLIDEMDDCIASMEEDDQYLTSVDTRYIQTLEQENAYFRSEMQMVNIRMMQLNNNLYNEQVKSNALAEAIRMASLKN